MKEDILEQLVDDYLQAKGYFTRHNVKFKPSSIADGYDAKKDRVDSDIDVVGFNPLCEGPDRVWVVSCKSWQTGFNPTQWITYIEKGIEQEKETELATDNTDEPDWNRSDSRSFVSIRGFCLYRAVRKT